MRAGINYLSSAGKGRRTIFREAIDIESAWQKAGPEWALTDRNTFASFQALRKQCTELNAAFIGAYSPWRTQSEILNQRAALLNEASIAWYAAATRIFLAGTAEGDMIRRSIPTLYAPAVPAVPTGPPVATQQPVMVM